MYVNGEKLSMKIITINRKIKNYNNNNNNNNKKQLRIEIALMFLSDISFSNFLALLLSQLDNFPFNYSHLILCHIITIFLFTHYTEEGLQ